MCCGGHTTSDLDAAATTIVAGAFSHNGQICMNIGRVFVVKEIYKGFFEKVLEVARNTKRKPHL